VRAISTAELQRQALELRKQGFTYEEVGAGIARSTSYAHKLVTDAIANIPRELANDVRNLELARLDSLQKAHWINATADTKPSVKAAGIILRVMERRAAMLGLDAPKQEIVWGSGEPFDVDKALG
jgi:hypothetical protein